MNPIDQALKGRNKGRRTNYNQSHTYRPSIIPPFQGLNPYRRETQGVALAFCMSPFQGLAET